jgi:glucosamine--fructose-6-phosphate aminotransferase (isomerizing)
MPRIPNVIEGAYLQDILEQPDAMRRTTQSLAGAPFLSADLLSLCTKNAVERIVLTGMGSSFHALHPLHIRLTLAGHFCTMVETSEALHYLPDLFSKNTLTVAVSQSGESAEIVRLLCDGYLKGPIVGITNTPNSTLARLSNLTILTEAGPESTVTCKTYLAGLQALHWLGAIFLNEKLTLTAQHLEDAASEVERYLGQWMAHTASLQNELEGIEQIFITGRGYSLATAGTGGLIMKESTRSPAEGLSSAAFRHGPMEMLSSRVLACICLGDSKTASLNQRLYEEAHKARAKALLIGSGSDHPACTLPDCPAPLLPILEILPVQMLSLALAARLGFEAGNFALASKITATE